MKRKDTPCMNLSERNERIKRKPLRKRTKKRKRRIKGLLMILLMLAVAVLVVKSLSSVFSFSTINDLDSEEYRAALQSDVDTYTPEKYEEDELITRLSELAETSSEYKSIFERQYDYPKALLAAVCNNPEMLEFTIGYLDAEPKANGGFSNEELDAEYPLLLQWDKRWGYVPYGDGCLGLTGCAPSCISTVSLMLTGNKELTPDRVAKLAEENGHYIDGVGTSWSLLTDGLSEFGLTAKEMPLNKKEIIASLKDGYPIICSMREGIFTTSGHFIVLAGEKDGKIIIRDSNSISRSELLWDYDTISGEIKNLWVLSEK